MSLTTCSPIWIATSSDDAQYFPSRNSRTKTGTLAPTFTFRTRSLRTTFPANKRFTLSSRASRWVGGESAPLLMAHTPSRTGISVGERYSSASVVGS